MWGRWWREAGADVVTMVSPGPWPGEIGQCLCGVTRGNSYPAMIWPLAHSLSPVAPPAYKTAHCLSADTGMDWPMKECGGFTFINRDSCVNDIFIDT